MEGEGPDCKEGGEVWMEVSKACLMRCAVSGQRPVSLKALKERKLTEGGRRVRHLHVSHSNGLKREQSLDKTS